jgi:CelD/BcsL family acetyltransferase involved in cellulose biosynthesis
MDLKSDRVSGYAAEIRTAAEMESEVEAWRDLAARAGEQNIFAGPDVVLPGMQHLPEGRGSMLLLVWEGARSTAAGGILRGVLPIVMPRLPMVRRVKVWCPVPDAPGIPLIDGASPGEVIEAALAFLAARHPRFTGLEFLRVPADGAFAAALRAAAGRTRRAITASATCRRRILVGSEGMRRRIINDLHEGRQRLSVLGPVEMDRARTGRWVRDAVEEFLVLDAGAARPGGALLQSTGTANFLRTATRRLAQAGHCRVDVLRAGGRAIAAAIVIEDERQAWLWHVAADPSLAGLTPETQLILDVTRTQLDRTDIARTEACAGCEALVMQDFWREETAADYRVALRPQSSPAALAARIGEELKRNLRFMSREAFSRPAVS